MYNRSDIDLFVDKRGKVKIIQGLQTRYNGGYDESSPAEHEYCLFNSQLDHRVLCYGRGIYNICTPTEARKMEDKIVGRFHSAHHMRSMGYDKVNE